jgi:hypothetical protein
MELVHKSWTTSGLGPRWTAAVRPRAWRCAHQSIVRRRCGSPVVAARGRGGRGGRGGDGGALIEDGVAVKRPGDDGKASVMKACAGGELQRERGGQCGVRRGEVRPGCLL